MDFIFKLNKEMTLIMITHRLARVKSVDKIFYLKSGKSVAQGKFEEIRELVPDFEEQLEFLNK
jgi:ABC-type transport system involved in cytochrome bd biosynthesis fused ATPase/permease subunit